MVSMVYNIQDPYGVLSNNEYPDATVQMHGKAWVLTNLFAHGIFFY